MKKFGFIPCFLITLTAAVILQLTEIWQLMIIAGIIGGILAKNFKTAITSGFLGFLACWGIFFSFLSLTEPYSFGLAFSYLSTFFVIGLLLIGVLGLLSASIGYFSITILEKRKLKTKIVHAP